MRYSIKQIKSANYNKHIKNATHYQRLETTYSEIMKI